MNCFTIFLRGGKLKIVVLSKVANNKNREKVKIYINLRGKNTRIGQLYT